MRNVKLITTVGLSSFLAAAGLAAATLPASASIAPRVSVSHASMAAAVKLAGGQSTSICSQAEISAKVSACINTVCAPHYNPTSGEWASCVNSCVNRAQADCHGLPG